MLALALPLSFFLVMLETAIGSFLVLYLLDVYGGLATARLIVQTSAKQSVQNAVPSDDAPAATPKTLSVAAAQKRVGVTKGFLVFQAILYLILALLTYWFGSFFATSAVFADPRVYQQYPVDRAWMNQQFIPLLVFMGLLLVYNVLLWFNLRLARWIVGALTCLAGLVELLVIGMAYRPLAAASLGGAFTIGGILAGALGLGGVLTAMLLGHWYLNTPTASGKPLEFATLVMLLGVGAELLFSFFTHSTLIAGKAQLGTPPIPAGGLEVMRFLFGFLLTLGMGFLAYQLTRGRSFQSATGMLYLAVAFAFTGEILARGLFFLPPLS